MNTETIYTLISYMPDGVEYCRGCEVSRSSSGFDISVSDNINDIIEEWGKILYMNQDPSLLEKWEVTFLINGHKDDFWLPQTSPRTIELRREVEGKATAVCQSLLDDDRRVKEAKTQYAAEQARLEHQRFALQSEEKERQEYLRLRTKYGD